MPLRTVLAFKHVPAPQLFYIVSHNPSMLYMVTSPVSRQYDAMWEVEWALSECRIEKTKFRGLFLVETEEDALKKIETYPTQAVDRVFPIHRIVKSDLELIESTAVEIAVERIVPEEVFAVRCRNRHSPLDSQEVERRLGATIVKTIGCRVNLENPDKVVRVEILGGRTGISVLGSGDVLKKVVVY